MINGFACEFDMDFGNCLKLKIFDGRKWYIVDSSSVRVLMCNQKSKLIKSHGALSSENKLLSQILRETFKNYTFFYPPVSSRQGIENWT